MFCLPLEHRILAQPHNFVVLLCAVLLVLAGSAAGQTAETGPHWAFQPLQQTPTPRPMDEAGWARTDIDRFILARQEQAGLSPNPEADRVTLIRRAYFDLIGLPPSPEQIDAFIADPDPAAYDKLIGQLLASEHYGERWGRHWLDAARYGDSRGYRYDDPIPFAWAYRDFVIRAFNDDLPFDTFVRWQLAGDELEPGNPAALAATGFLAVGPAERDEGTDRNKLENKYNELDDMVSTTFTATLGLSMNCARCHDHKFDPIGIDEYYSVTTAFMTGQRQVRPMLTSEQEVEYQAWEASVDRAQRDFARWKRDNRAAIQAALDRHTQNQRQRIETVEQAFLSALGNDLPADQSIADAIQEQGPALIGQAETRRYAELVKQLGNQQRQIQRDPERMRTGLGPEKFEQWDAHQRTISRLQRAEPEVRKAQVFVEDTDQPEAGVILERGSIDHPGQSVVAGHLGVLTAADYAPPDLDRPVANSTYQRAELAYWLTDVDHGAGFLLARVIVNRVWLNHFGQGLVRTPDDFGTQADPPALPALLDHLALELIDSGWSIKDLHRSIMTSAVYRQSTAHDDIRAELDPENRLWWRRSPRRMEAEILRDAMLAVSGELNPEMFGPSVYLPIPEEAIITRLGKAYPKDIADGPAIHRRSVYAFVMRTVPVPMFQAFDAADPSASCGRRIETTVAPQALFLMNSDFARRRSAGFADRLLAASADPAEQIDLGFTLTLGRPATDQERGQSLAFLQAQRARHDGDAKAALTDFCQVLFSTNAFIFID